jgi:RNA polymerase sigma-70 factor (ECF subfamily)
MELAELRAQLEELHPASFGWALSCCRQNYAEAEEVLQTVYLKILQGKASFDGQSKLQTWLFAVIRNTAISERRKTLVRSIATPPFENTISARSQIELERSEMQLRFQAALQRLPARQRETLHLVFYQELSLGEAAQVMSISIGSARQHYERGKKRLRELLDQEEVDYGIGWRREENPGTVL